MLKYSLIVFFNLIFIPLYTICLVLSFLVTFIPIFPVVTAQKNVRDRLLFVGLKNRFFVTLVCQNYVFYLFEILFFDFFRLTQASLPKNFIIEDFLKEVRDVFPEAATKGFTYLAGHVANLESQNIPLVQANKILRNQQTVVGLAKPSRSKIFNTILSWHRLRPGVGVIWTDKNLFENMNRAVDQGDSLCLIADQKPRKNGVFIRFFGKYAPFPTTGVKFCSEKKSIFIYAFAQRFIPGWINVTYECGRNLHLNPKPQSQPYGVFSKLEKMFPGDLLADELSDEQDKNVRLEMAYFVKWLEDHIKEIPTQWCWDYRKWSREPL